MTEVDLLRALTTILAAAAAAWVAARVALHRWRAELIGKRRAEVAETALTAFYKFKKEFIHIQVRLGRVGGELTLLENKLEKPYG